MSQIVKVFTGILFLMLQTMLGSGIIGAQLESSNAREYRQCVAAEIENSNFCKEVMYACIRQAAQDGYALTLNVYQEGEECIEMTKENESQIEVADIEMVEILLNYDYSIPFLNYKSRHCIRGMQYEKDTGGIWRKHGISDLWRSCHEYLMEGYADRRWILEERGEINGTFYGRIWWSAACRSGCCSSIWYGWCIACGAW